MKFTFSILICITLVTSQKSFSQGVIDTSILQLRYNYSYIIDTSTKEMAYNEPMILEIGYKSSKYYNYYRKIGDSLLLIDLQSGKINITNAPSQIISNPGYYQKKNPSIIFQNFPNGYITEQTKLIKDYEFSEIMEKQIWELLPDSYNILGYNCQKAKTFFRGRSYEAWFAPDIPYQYGPWKFNSLPGVILKISDIKNNFIFECVEIVKSEPKRGIDKKEGLIKTTKKEFGLISQTYRENPQLLLNQFGAKIISIKDSNGNPVDINSKTIKKRKSYNPIELTTD